MGLQAKNRTLALKLMIVFVQRLALWFFMHYYAYLLPFIELNLKE